MGSEMKSPFERVKLWCCFAALLFSSLRLSAQETNPQRPNPNLEQAERRVKALAKQFPDILIRTPLESQLQANCAADCTSVVNRHSGFTVAQELDNITASRQARMAHVGAEIQRCVDNYVMSLPPTRDRGLNPKFVASQLSRILSGVEDRPPNVFVLASGRGRVLLIFDNVLNGTNDSSYAALNAFSADGQKLTESDSTGRDMDGYGGIDVTELPSPVQGEIWLLFSGNVLGANGPNCRMRIFAYDGKRFRTVWAPANIWGSFTIKLVPKGFVVSGDDYESNQHRYDRYHLTSDGIYWLPKGK